MRDICSAVPVAKKEADISADTRKTDGITFAGGLENVRFSGNHLSEKKYQ